MTLSHTHTHTPGLTLLSPSLPGLHPPVWHEFQTKNLINTGGVSISDTGISDTGLSDSGMLDTGTYVLGVSDKDKEMTQTKAV